MISNLVLADLVRIAYMRYTSEGEVSGGPKWASVDRFEIVGKVDDADRVGWEKLTEIQRMDAVQPMLQALLVERFKLQLHREMRVTAVFALVQAKNGTKLKEVSPPIGDSGDAGSEGGNGPESVSRKPPIGGFSLSNGQWVARAVQVPNVLWMIAARTGYTASPMIDATGLAGYYDFSMKLPELKDTADFEKEVESQLGLRVETQKIPYPTYVIDAAEKPSLDGTDSQ